MRAKFHLFVLCLGITVIYVSYCILQALNTNHRTIMINSPPYNVAPHKSSLHKSMLLLQGSEVESKFRTIKTQECHLTLQDIRIRRNNRLWQRVADISTFVYSAFYDRRFHFSGQVYHYIRILAMMQRIEAGDVHFYCYLWYLTMQRPVVVEAELNEIWQAQWGGNVNETFYNTYIISCPIPLQYSRNSSLISDKVSLMPFSCVKPSNVLQIQHSFAREKKGIANEFVVCVKGLDFRDDITNRLKEWIEMNYILGADKIDFYLFRVANETLRLLRSYESLGKVSLFELTLPGDQPNGSDERSRYNKRHIWQKRRNELLPYNDCFYRNMYSYKYVIPLDIDELILPVMDTNWSAMLRRFFHSNPVSRDTFASFSVQNVYFLDSFYNEPPKSFSYFLPRIIRATNFSLKGHSVKSFVSTSNTLATFNHYTLLPLYPWVKTNKVMSTTVAQMNHYRDKCPREIYSQCKAKFLKYNIKDEIIFKFKSLLLQKLNM